MKNSPYPPARRMHPANPNSKFPYPNGETPEVRILARSHAPAVATFPVTTRVLILASLLAAFVFCILGIFGFVFFKKISDNILPGVSVGSTPLGGLSITEGAVELQKAWNLEKKIVVSSGLDTAAVAPSQLGLSLDVLAAVEQAYAVGHHGSFTDNLGNLLVSLVDGWQIIPTVHFDENAAQAGINALIPLLSKSPVNASISVQGSSLTAVPGEIGYTINIQQTIETISANRIAVMDQGILQLQLQPVPPAVNDATPLLEAAGRLIHTPAKFRAYDAVIDEFVDFSISKDTLVSWLAIEVGENSPRLSLNPERIAATLAQFSATLGQGRFLDAQQYGAQLAQAVLESRTTTILISHLPSSYLVQPGDTLLKIGWKLGIPYWKIIQANPEINPDNLLSGTSLTIPSKDELIPLPVVLNKRIIISIPKQRLWVYQDGSLLSEFIISTGIDRSPTQPGVFQVQSHEKNAYASVWDLTMPNFLGVYEAWPGFMNGIHGLPTLSNGQRLWANILGKPASYGCIILGLDDAKWLYNWADEGVIVEIRS